MGSQLEFKVGQPFLSQWWSGLCELPRYYTTGALLSEDAYDDYCYYATELELWGLQHGIHVMQKMNAEYGRMEAATLASPHPPSPGVGHPMCQGEDLTSLNTPVTSPLSRLNSPAAVEWLLEHYEEQEGISLPRGAMYSHYLDYCHDLDFEPMNQASFGKVIRAVFPNVKTRRLGTRGQSKYHYYGVTIKDCSPYKDIMLSSQRVNNITNTGSKGLHSRTVAQTSLPRSSSSVTSALTAGVLLPDFPTIDRLQIPPEIKDTASVFLMMYKHHTQRVVDTILRANFAEVKEFVIHFWQTLPGHITAVLHHKVVVDLIALCDTILYRAICGLLIPGVLQPLPGSLITAIRLFGQDLYGWLKEALESQPTELKEKKLQVAKSFGIRLRHQTEVSHMAAVARTYLHSCECVKKLQEDWKRMDIRAVIQDCAVITNISTGTEFLQIQKHFSDFERMLDQQTTIDRYVEWIRTLVDKYVFKAEQDSGKDGRASNFLKRWSYFTSVVSRELTVNSCEMFGACHLVGLLFKDYVSYLIQENQRETAENELKHQVYKDCAKQEEEEAVQIPPRATSSNLASLDSMTDVLNSSGSSSSASISSECFMNNSFPFCSDKFGTCLPTNLCTSASLNTSSVPLSSSMVPFAESPIHSLANSTSQCHSFWNLPPDGIIHSTRPRSVNDSEVAHYRLADSEAHCYHGNQGQSSELTKSHSELTKKETSLTARVLNFDPAEHNFEHERSIYPVSHQCTQPGTAKATNPFSDSPVSPVRHSRPMKRQFPGLEEAIRSHPCIFNVHNQQTKNTVCNSDKNHTSTYIPASSMESYPMVQSSPCPSENFASWGISETVSYPVPSFYDNFHSGHANKSPKSRTGPYLGSANRQFDGRSQKGFASASQNLHKECQTDQPNSYIQNQLQCDSWSDSCIVGMGYSHPIKLSKRKRADSNHILVGDVNYQHTLRP